MTNEEILKSALEKAISNGFRDIDLKNDLTYDFITVLKDHIYCITYRKDIQKFEHFSLYELIFSHDFAKAFWKNCGKMNTYCEGSGCSKQIKTWKYHLQQMVLEEDPILYLQQFL